MTRPIRDELIAGVFPESDSSPRTAMIACAAALIGRNGVAGTSIGEVLAAAAAPRGSVYHHFPSGRSELLAEAVQYGGDRLSDWATGSFDHPAELISAVVGSWRGLLERSQFTVGCPVSAGAQADPDDAAVAAVAEVARQVLRSWNHLLTAALRGYGIEEHAADRLSVLLMSSVFGAIPLCRVHRSTAPLDSVAASLSSLVASVARAR